MHSMMEGGSVDSAARPGEWHGPLSFTWVVTQGLKAVSKNGKIGYVGMFRDTTERYVVMTIGSTAALALKPSNLRPVAEIEMKILEGSRAEEIAAWIRLLGSKGTSW